MNRYETCVSTISRSIVTTAEKVSDSIVGIALALVAVISAIPEFLGIWEVSDKWLLGLAIAGMGATVTRMAVRRKNRYGWGAFVAHLVIAEVTIGIYSGGGVEMVFPFVTAIGAAVMALSNEHEEETAEKRQDRRDTVQFNRSLKLLKAEAEAEAIRIEAENAHLAASVQGVQLNTLDTVQETEHNLEQSRKLTERQMSLLDIVRTHGDLGVSEFAKRLNVKSRTTIYADLSKLESAGLIHRGSNGIEATPTIAPTLPEPPQIELNGISK